MDYDPSMINADDLLTRSRPQGVRPRTGVSGRFDDRRSRGRGRGRRQPLSEDEIAERVKSLNLTLTQESEDKSFKERRMQTRSQAQRSFNEAHRQLWASGEIERRCLKKNLTVLDFMKLVAEGASFSNHARRAERDVVRAKITRRLKNRAIFSRIHNDSFQIYGIAWTMTPSATYHGEWDESFHVTLDGHARSMMMMNSQPFITEETTLDQDQPIIICKNPPHLIFTRPLLLLPELCGMII